MGRNWFAVSAVLLAGVIGAHTAFAQDPGVAGPYAVTRTEYNFGDLVVRPTDGGKIEARASVHYPTALVGGPFPLVLLLHGRHSTCYYLDSQYLEWPCSSPKQSIPNYKGYDYIANGLASHGFVVVSISANGLSVRDNNLADFGARSRAELIQYHLNLWATFNSTGGSPFGTQFINQIDLTRVGTMGHSRGGEGTMRHISHNASLGSPFGIKATLAIAPTNYLRRVVDNVPFGVVIPYCDGDLGTLPGVHYFDDARYAVSGDAAPKHMFAAMGANHNFFNTVWVPASGYVGAYDDWMYTSDPACGPGGSLRLTAAEQQAMARAYTVGFFRRYLSDETEFAPLLAGDVEPPPSALDPIVFTSYQPPDRPSERRDINRLVSSGNLTTNFLGGAVTRTALTSYEICGGSSYCLNGVWPSQQPHQPGLYQLRLGWSTAGASYATDIPASASDVSRFQALQFRAGVMFNDSRNPAGQPVNVKIKLTDAAGASASVRVGDYSAALFYPPGASAMLPRQLLNTVRVPLTAFAGVNLGSIRSVQFVFDQQSTGALLLGDLAFADVKTVSPPDLVETSVSPGAAVVAPGQGLSVLDTVLNQGAGPASSSTTKYYLSLDAAKNAADISLAGNTDVPALLAGRSSQNAANVVVPTSTPVGDYYVLACSDALDELQEAAEGNNCSATTLTIRVASAGTKPDLTVTAVSPPPSSGLVGKTFDVTDTVTNQGVTGAGSSTTRYYLSFDAVRSIDDFKLTGNRGVASLSVGAHSTGTKAVTIPAGTPAATYRLLACADDTLLVNEGGNEGNNCRAATGTIVVTGADLVTTAVSNPPAARVLGGSFNVSDTVQNQGAVASSASTTRYYLSLDDRKSSADVRMTGSRSIQSLSPGQSSSGSVSVTVPSSKTAPGIYYLIACGDDTGGTVETAETNNCRVSTSTITISQ